MFMVNLISIANKDKKAKNLVVIDSEIWEHFHMQWCNQERGRGSPFLELLRPHLSPSNEIVLMLNWMVCYNKQQAPHPQITSLPQLASKWKWLVTPLFTCMQDRCFVIIIYLENAFSRNQRLNRPTFLKQFEVIHWYLTCL